MCNLLNQVEIWFDSRVMKMLSVKYRVVEDLWSSVIFLVKSFRYLDGFQQITLIYEILILISLLYRTDSGEPTPAITDSESHNHKSQS